MTTPLCTHAALTPGTDPSIDQITGELRIPITLYRIDEPILRVDLVVSASEIGFSVLRQRTPEDAEPPVSSVIGDGG
jgi:hypothetical protein